MKVAAISAIALASLSQLVSGYAINGDNVNCRSGPGTSFDAVRKYSRGDDVTLSCQTEGEAVRGDSLWGKTTDGCYVADYYVQTGTSSYVADKCGASDSGSGNNGGDSGNTGNTGGSGFCKNVNSATLEMVKDFEGFESSPAPDPIGLPTVGYGHLCETKGCGEVTYSFPLTESTALSLLKDDLPKYSICLAGYLKSSVALNDNQWGALTSWVFNVGCGNAKSSTLVSRLNAGEDPNKVVSDELPQWRLAGGKVFSGLVRRRAAEVKLFTTPSSSQAFPNCQ
ncbi:hypothetical protein FBU59_000030 [Linderina macrospora]|uniref:Uncharacterized protein n=1 Tax=Linderina macrospora TaxID=4868 RepID=A0ACC1JI61_9FUNG|nr:hypothetical protein FBU59_000030 [Linderina macrospora]